MSTILTALVLLASPPDVLDSWLRQPALPDAELVMRAIEVHQQLITLDEAPDAGPSRQADLEQRARALETALAGAPVDVLNAPKLARLLRGKWVEAQARSAALSVGLGPRHPKMQKAQALTDEYRRLLALLDVSPLLERMPEPPAELLVRRDELAARALVLERLYLDKHPRLVAGRAQLESVTQQLARAPALSRSDCERARLVFDRRIESLRASTRAAANDSHEKLEEDAALDALLIARARLSVDEPSCAPRPVQNPIILAPVAELGGDAYLRARLSKGAVLQMNRTCGEFGGGGEGVLIVGKSRVVRFGEGRATELNGHVLIESNVVVRDEEHAGRVVYSRGTDDVLAFRVIGIDLATGVLREAPWDTFAPASAGKKRFIGLLKARGSRHSGQAEAWDVLVWELATGKTRTVGSGTGPFEWRVSGAEVIAPTAQPIAFDGSTGKVRVVPQGERSTLGDGLGWINASVGGDAPLEWQSCEGRDVRIRFATDLIKPHVVGGCRTLGPHWEAGLLFTDRGVFRWPAELQLCR